MTLLSPRREVGEFRRRYKWMALFSVAVFAVLLVRVFQLQVLQYDALAATARENITRTIQLPATRGLIRDRNGDVIATNRPSYNVYVVPQDFDLARDFPRLVSLMGLDAPAREALRQRIERVPLRRRTHQIEIFRDISRNQLAALEQHLSDFCTNPRCTTTSLNVVSTPMRLYPHGALAAHAIGYLNEVDAEDLARLRGQGYRAGDTLGRSGIERAWESYLRGRRGVRRVIVDVHGQSRDDGASRETKVEPVPGRDLTLTLDMALMQIVEKAFRGHPSGGAVVVEATTGRVRALFSKPAYDLNEMSGRLSSERAREMLDNPFRPLIDKTIYESYFPGSTFKPIAAFAALGDGILTPSRRVTCTGVYEISAHERKRCTKVHGEVDMHSAIVQSCNVYFYDLALQVGLDRLNRYALDFGLGEKTGIGINTETSGFIPTRGWYQQHYERFRPGYTLNEAIGQGNMRVTLMQLALLYAAIANGGTLYAPQLVERVSGPDGAVMEEFQPRVRRRVQVKPEHLALVVDGLFGVVNDPLGTAYEARVDGAVLTAGKTGTAEISRRTLRPGEDPRRAWYDNRAHAWFAGFAPANAPEMVVIVLVEHGGAGGRAAAPIGTQILAEYFRARQPTEPAPVVATLGGP